MEHLIRQFEKDGYILLPGFFNAGEMDALLQTIQDEGQRLSLNSNLSRDHMLFYSNLYRNNKKLQEFISTQHITDLICSLAKEDIWVRWDQAVKKAPGGEEFPWHQDNSYNKLPVEHFQLWIAITDMKEENGGLWLMPGSHRQGLLPHIKIDNHQYHSIKQENAVCINAKKGDIVIFSSLLLHRTSPNVTNTDRWAYVVEYMKQSDFDPYIEPPYFMISENRLSIPRFADNFPNLGLGSRFNYYCHVIGKSLQKEVNRLKQKAGRYLKSGK